MEQPELVMKFLTVLGAPLSACNLATICKTEIFVYEQFVIFGLVILNNWKARVIQLVPMAEQGKVRVIQLVPMVEQGNFTRTGTQQSVLHEPLECFKQSVYTARRNRGF